jgi:antitoxin component of RelBE/YafQ-DinJ toxin-antitoxin module
VEYETPKFSKEELVTWLAHLNEELQQMGVTGELCVVGGAAMVIGYGSRASTRDIDALLISPASVRAAIQRVAERDHLPPSWLNDGAKGFASGKAIEAKELLKMSHLRVVAPPPEYILAMKCISARVGIDEHDKEDAKYLIQHLGLRSSDAVREIVAKYYDARRIPAKTQYFIQEICDELFTKT